MHHSRLLLSLASSFISGSSLIFYSPLVVLPSFTTYYYNYYNYNYNYYYYNYMGLTTGLENGFYTGCFFFSSLFFFFSFLFFFFPFAFLIIWSFLLTLGMAGCAVLYFSFSFFFFLSSFLSSFSFLLSFLFFFSLSFLLFLFAVFSLSLSLRGGLLGANGVIRWLTPWLGWDRSILPWNLDALAACIMLGGWDFNLVVFSGVSTTKVHVEMAFCGLLGLFSVDSFDICLLVSVLILMVSAMSPCLPFW
ncbi:hypothetical protein LI328DRAFT_136493 [Trichoderma asperelloides]|nr:hypothetical protein LI328DRAFT_136493 [Trichoderma asperelloides]